MNILHFFNLFDWDVFTFTFFCVLGAMLVGLALVQICNWLELR
jgi:hypothetical protein